MTADQSTQANSGRQQEAAAWLLKNRDLNQSAHELRAFEEWLDRDQENRTAYEAAERLTGEVPTSGKPHKLSIFLAIAILVAALAGGALVLMQG